MNSKIIILLLIQIICINCYSQKFYLDANNKKITSKIFQKNWRDDKLNLYRWDYIKKDSGRVAKLCDNQFRFFKVNYDTICKEIGSITKKKLPKNATIIIEFIHANDLCNSEENPNKWDRDKLNHRDLVSNEPRNNIKFNNSNNFYLVVFDKDIDADLYITSIENFCVDKNNFFKNTFLQKPAFCGSYIALKPDGYLLVRNGEFRADFFLSYLEPSVWCETFKGFE
ncbi:MAG: hypothetical protein WCJ62_07555 [Flavobacterium sp.]